MQLLIKASLRADDDRILALLSRAHGGERLVDIERDLGLAPNSGTVLIKRVLRDDLRCSGEPEDVVRAGYRRRPKVTARTVT